MSDYAGASSGDELFLPDDDQGEQQALHDEFEYTRFVSQLRVLETRLLTRSQLLRMVEAPDAEAAFRLLAETEYAAAVAAAGSPAEYEVALSSELSRVFTMLRRNAPEPDLVWVLGLGYDWLNLKTVLKAALAAKPVEAHQLVAAGNLPHEQLMAIARGGSLEVLPEPYRSAGTAAARAFGTTGDPQEIDFVLDAVRFTSIGRLATAHGFELVAKVAQATADLVNLRTALRLRLLRAGASALDRAFVAGGSIDKSRLAAAMVLEPEEMAVALAGVSHSDVFAAGVASYRQTGSLAQFEKLMDDRVLSLVHAARYTAFGPDPIIAYLLAKEAEIKNLRIVFTGKLNQLPENSIRERLRETYA